MNNFLKVRCDRFIKDDLYTSESHTVVRKQIEITILNSLLRSGPKSREFESSSGEEEEKKTAGVMLGQSFPLLLNAKDQLLAHPFLNAK